MLRMEDACWCRTSCACMMVGCACMMASCAFMRTYCACMMACCASMMACWHVVHPSLGIVHPWSDGMSCMHEGRECRVRNSLRCTCATWKVQSSLILHVAMECGYCGRAVQPEDKWLPVECHKCQGLFHLGCLKGERPPALMGDQLFHFTCAYCRPLGNEQCYRPNLHWWGGLREPTV